MGALPGTTAVLNYGRKLFGPEWTFYVSVVSGLLLCLISRPEKNPGRDRSITLPGTTVASNYGRKAISGLPNQFIYSHLLHHACQRHNKSYSIVLIEFYIST